MADMDTMDDASVPARRGYGRAFVDLFRELGYEGGDLTPDTFEWMFGLPSLRVQAFLDWFLNSVKPRQSVKRQLPGKQDYAIYCALLKGKIGHGMLYGEALVRAEIACQSDLAMQNANEDDSLDALNAENAVLEQEIADLERKLRLASGRNDRLGKLVQRKTLVADHQAQKHHQEQHKEHFTPLLHELKTSVAVRSRKTPSITSPETLQRQLHDILRHLSTSSSEHPIVAAANGALVSVASSALVSRSHPTPTSATPLTLDGQPRVWKDFLYQHDLASLETIEIANLETLKGRIPSISTISSVLPTGPTSTSASNDVAVSPAPKPRRGDPMAPPSPWLHESDPNQMHMREQDALLYNKCSIELERLRNAFVIGQRDALLAQMQVTRYESHLHQLTTSRRQLLQQFQLMSRDAIWARKQALLASMEKTKHQLTELLGTVFPEKLETLALLKSTSILLQSYEQKLWRQEHRFLKLRGLLEGFDKQHARLKLVHRLLDAERQDILHVEAIFRRLTTQLQQLNELTHKRIVSYDTSSGSDAAFDTLGRSYLNEHDRLAHELFETLQRVVKGEENGESDHQHSRLRTFDKIVRLCELKLSNEQSAQATMQQIRSEWSQLYDSKRYTLNRLRVELFGDSTSSTPLLLPVDLATQLHQAVAAQDHVEQALQAALETLRLHKRAVTADPTKRMQQERDIARLHTQVAAHRGELGSHNI
ncbi:hypothetical protein Poli38472_007671 [Pythium oligandrum]|uniref:HAUS augmin-like complex subunit 3 N-terminal domain-containing protein n=1 Tax=Pythium oligandrum TaxID=41045 RepID=A0A8K1CRN0_PYTOL|nr:hypothetical protein Poli38472_007671 [Pythium oligandrum]|eukprot:TMW67999.1 hypothetical protein Poli38472_007671 [Pythium oligandrum]